MRESIVIGSTPAAEECAQVGRSSLNEMRRECRVFRNQLRRVFGAEPEGAELRIMTYPHDFGSYVEVVAFFDPEVEAAVAYAFRLEAEAPSHWDEPARVELAANITAVAR